MRDDETDAPDAPDGSPDPARDPSVEYDDLFGAPALDSEESSGGGDDTDARASRTSETDSGPTEETDMQATAVAEADSPRPTAATDDGLATEWPRVVRAVKEEHISLGSLLDEAEPVECTGGTLTVAVPRTLHRNTLRDRKRVLLQHVTATTERSVEEIRFVVEDTTADAAADTAASEEPLSPREQLQQLRDTYPALDILFGDFGAEPVW
jgi:hypothetical protein